MTDYNLRSRIVKKALANKYGFKNVRVEKGRGTAGGWIEANIKIPKAAKCYCDQLVNSYCDNCREKINETRRSAELIAEAALKSENMAFSTYIADDGYNSEHSCFLVHIEFDPELTADYLPLHPVHVGEKKDE